MVVKVLMVISLQALCALQISDTTLYLAAAVVIYRYTGEGVVSPALGSSTRLLEKIAYGIAIPTIVISGVINGHVAAVSPLSLARLAEGSAEKLAEIYLRPYVPWVRAPWKQILVRWRVLGGHYHHLMGYCVDHCRGYTSV